MMERDVIKTILTRANELLEAGEPAETLRCLDRISGELFESDDRIECGSLRAWALSELGRVDDALEELEPLLDEFPRSARLHNTRGVVLSNAEDLEQARDALAKAVELDEDDDSAWANYGLVLEKLRDFEQALAVYEHVGQLGGDIGWLLQRMASVHAELGETESAKRLLKRYLSLEPDDEEQWLALGLLYADDDQFRDAAICFRQSEQIDPASPALRLHWGIAAVTAEQLDVARQQLIYLSRREPHSARTLLLRAMIAERSGDEEAARRDVEKVLRRLPNDRPEECTYLLQAAMDFFARQGRIPRCREVFATAYRINVCSVELCELYREAVGEELPSGGWYSLLIEADYRPGLREVYDHRDPRRAGFPRYERFQRNIQVIARDPDDAILRTTRLLRQMGEKHIRVCEIAAQEPVSDDYAGVYEIERESLVFRR